MWVTAAWGPAFSAYLHSYLELTKRNSPAERELYAGEILNSAIASGLKCRAVRLPDGQAIEIGTAADFAAAWQLDF